MEMSGEQRIAAPRETVWAALNDPEILKACIPGCQKLEGDLDKGLAATVTAKVGPVKATFQGAVTFSEVVPPESYVISGEGKGGVAGFAKGSARVFLKDEGSETLLTYSVQAQVGGKLAQLGGRLIDSTARHMAEQFFACFCEKAAASSGEPPPAAGAAYVSPEEAHVSPALETLPAAPNVPVASPATSSSGRSGWIIGIGVVVVAAILYGVLA